MSLLAKGEEAPAQRRAGPRIASQTRLCSRPGGAGIEMETPGSGTRDLSLPATSGRPRKRGASELGAASSKPRVLDEEEFIEVRPPSGHWRLPGPSATAGVPGVAVRALPSVCALGVRTVPRAEWMVQREVSAVAEVLGSIARAGRGTCMRRCGE